MELRAGSAHQPATAALLPTTRCLEAGRVASIATLVRVR